MRSRLPIRDLIALALVAALPRLAYAGGFEILEQSPAGVGTAGAQAARAEDASAVFYNPAGMAFQRGYNGLAGANVIVADGVVKTDPPNATRGETKTTLVQPYAYGVQRLGSHFAVGLAGFANFGQDQEYANPSKFAGRFLGTFINITTFTLNPSFAFRPVPRFAFGLGLDVTPASLELKRALNFGGGEGTLHDSMTATGVGGNLGVLVQIVPQYLHFGFTYRSAMQLNFSGKASVTTPPELFGAAPSLQNSKTSMTLPHNFTFGLSSRPVKQLSLDVDVHYALWHDIQSLTLSLSDPKAPAGTPPNVQGSQLLFKDTVGVRLGAELRLLRDQLALRLGLGWDQTAVPSKTVAPLAPDGDRFIVGVGVGWHYKAFGAEAAYLATILPERTSTDPDFQAKYSTVAHIIGIALTRRGELFGKPTSSRYE
jgi:long-chain fatty acid transport protein